jgi:hypothetical protein
MAKIMEKRAMTPQEASEAYGLSVGTLANLRYQKLGPKYHVVHRRKILYFVLDIETWIKRNPVLTKDSLDDIQ